VLIKIRLKHEEIGFNMNKEDVLAYHFHVYTSDNKHEIVIKHQIKKDKTEGKRLLTQSSKMDECFCSFAGSAIIADFKKERNN